MIVILAIPALVSLWFLLALSRDGDLLGWRRLVAVVWFAVAFMLQMFVQHYFVSLLGLLAQVALAIVLVLKYQFEGVY